MFYTKYRPQKFSEMSKPNDAAHALMTQLASGKTSHAYLLIGPRGTGKTTTARILAKALNCKQLSKEGDPCDKCENCQTIREGKFLDLIEIDAASNRGIDDIRSLKERVNLAPAHAKYKVYIIDEVHMLTMEAFNALLKTLEEPPKHAVFVLCTTEGHKVPETIKSRCQVFKIKRATIKQIVERLEEICKKEKVKVLSKEDLEKIAGAAFGGFRDADTLLQQVIEGNITVDSLLGVSALESFVNLTNFIIKGKTQAALELVNDLFTEGVDLTNWSHEYIRYLRDLLYIQAGFNKGVTDVTDDVFASMEDQAFKLSSLELVHIIDKFLKASAEIKTAAISQLPLELAIVEVSERELSYAASKGDSDGDNDGGYGGDGDGVSADSSANSGKRDSKSRSGSGKASSDSASSSEDTITSVSLDSVIDKWGEILKEVKPFNHSVEALLRSAKPKSLANGTLSLEVFYAFHKERLESPKGREIIEKVLADKFGEKIKVKYLLKSKEGEALTDKNVEKPADVKIEKNALEVFDGGIVL